MTEVYVGAAHVLTAARVAGDGTVTPQRGARRAIVEQDSEIVALRASSRRRDHWSEIEAVQVGVAFRAHGITHTREAE